MLVIRKGSWRACWLLLPALLAGVLLVVCTRQRRLHHPASPVVPLHDWDIPQLVEHLNGAGLELCLLGTGKDGVVDQSAYLTTTPRKWADVNRLFKDATLIEQWEGTLYCERGPLPSWPGLTSLWGDCCLVVGPFLFFGDPQLLGRVRAALTGRHR
jgi:hypothetical protein